MTVALVTGGGGGGIGQGICSALAEDGFTVYVADRDEAAAQAVAAAIEERGGAAVALPLDVTDHAAVAEATARIVAEAGSIDALVNSAAVGLSAPVADITTETFDAVLDTNLKAVWHAIRCVVAPMRQAGGGSIVNIGSNHAIASQRGFGTYATAKAGLVGLTRAVAIDYGPANIRCNVVHPGLVDSPLNRTLLDETYGDAEAWMRRWIATRQMLPRAIEPADIGRVVAFLAGPASRAITGTEIVADAGTSRLLFDSE